MDTLTSVDRFGDLLRRYREQASMSQSELARALGTTQSAVSRWEKGGADPRLSTVLSVVRVLGRTIELGDGVDRTQIRQHLAMTPRQRLEAVANVSRLRAAVR